MRKIEKWHLLPSHCRYLTKLLQKCSLSGPLSGRWFFCPVLILIGCHGNQNAKNRKNILKNYLLRNHMEYRTETCRNILCISLYKILCFYCYCSKTLVALVTLSCHRLIMGKSEKMAFNIVKPLQIFWQNFYRNVPWVVLYQADNFSAQCSFCLVAMPAKIQNIEKNILKNHLLKNHMEYSTEICRTIPCISL